MPVAPARPNASPPHDATTLGPFAVAAEADGLAAYAAATGASAAAVPTTFPIVWLGRAEIRDALLALAAPGELAFHEEQVFDYAAPLEAGRTYRLWVELRRTEEPARIAVAARVEGQDGRPVLAMAVTLRLVGAGLAGAAA